MCRYYLGSDASEVGKSLLWTLVYLQILKQQLSALQNLIWRRIIGKYWSWTRGWSSDLLHPSNTWWNMYHNQILPKWSFPLEATRNIVFYETVSRGMKMFSCLVHLRLHQSRAGFTDFFYCCRYMRALVCPEDYEASPAALSHRQNDQIVQVICSPQGREKRFTKSESRSC